MLLLRNQRGCGAQAFFVWIWTIEDIFGTSGLVRDNCRDCVCQLPVGATTIPEKAKDGGDKEENDTDDCTCDGAWANAM